MQNNSAYPYPEWLPYDVRLYLQHTAAGMAIRAIARAENTHASTVARKIQRIEAQRDDPLIDLVLSQISTMIMAAASPPKPPLYNQQGQSTMKHPPKASLIPDNASIEREARRILRRLREPKTLLVVAPNMAKAAVLRQTLSGAYTKTAVVERDMVGIFILQDWIKRTNAKNNVAKVAKYTITNTGSNALKRLLFEQEKTNQAKSTSIPTKARVLGGGAVSGFAEQHITWGERNVIDDNGDVAKVRYNIAESPLTTLARRKDKDGRNFLSDDLVVAGEQLREDFEIAQIGPRLGQNWEKLITGAERNKALKNTNDLGDKALNARKRVIAAMDALGPSLSDIALSCCCLLEGIETAERRLGWSARSGKIVLRIALQRLAQYYNISSKQSPQYN